MFDPFASGAATEEAPNPDVQQLEAPQYAGFAQPSSAPDESGPLTVPIGWKNFRGTAVPDTAKKPIEGGLWAGIKRGVKDAMDENPATPIPFAGGLLDLADKGEVASVAWRYHNAVKEGRTPDPADEQFLMEQVSKMEDENQWMKSLTPAQRIGVRTGQILINLPAFMGEMAATAGISGAVRGGVSKALLPRLSKILTEKAAKRAVGPLSGIVAAAPRAAIGGAPRIASGTVTGMMPSLSLEHDDQLNIDKLISRDGDGFLEALYKSAGDQYIEYLSEMSGGFLSGIAKKGMSLIPGSAIAVGAKRAIVENILKRYPNLKTSDLLKQLSTAVAWNGPIGEWLEERAGEAGRAAIGVDSYKPLGGGSAQDMAEQGAAEILAFSIPPIGGMGLNYTANKLQQKFKANGKGFDNETFQRWVRSFEITEEKRNEIRNVVKELRASPPGSPQQAEVRQRLVKLIQPEETKVENKPSAAQVPPANPEAAPLATEPKPEPSGAAPAPEASPLAAAPENTPAPAAALAAQIVPQNGTDVTPGGAPAAPVDQTIATTASPVAPAAQAASRAQLSREDKRNALLAELLSTSRASSKPGAKAADTAPPSGARSTGGTDRPNAMWYDPVTDEIVENKEVIDSLRASMPEEKFNDWYSMAHVEEKIHQLIDYTFTEDELRDIGSKLPALQKASLKRSYFGRSNPEQWDDVLVAHEAIRKVIQRVKEGKTTELSRHEGWAEQTIQYLLDMLERILDRISGGIAQVDALKKEVVTAKEQIRGELRQRGNRNAAEQYIQTAIQQGAKSFEAAATRVKFAMMKDGKGNPSARMRELFDYLREAWEKAGGQANKNASAEKILGAEVPRTEAQRQIENDQRQQEQRERKVAAAAAQAAQAQGVPQAAPKENPAPGWVFFEQRDENYGKALASPNAAIVSDNPWVKVRWYAVPEADAKTEKAANRIQVSQKLTEAAALFSQNGQKPVEPLDPNNLPKGSLIEAAHKGMFSVRFSDKLKKGERATKQSEYTFFQRFVRFGRPILYKQISDLTVEDFFALRDALLKSGIATISARKVLTYVGGYIEKLRQTKITGGVSWNEFIEKVLNVPLKPESANANDRQVPDLITHIDAAKEKTQAGHEPAIDVEDGIRIIDYIRKRYPNHPEIALWFEFLWYSGARLEDVRKMTWAQVDQARDATDPNNRFIFILNTKNVKARRGVPYAVPLHRRLAEVINELSKLRRDPGNKNEALFSMFAGKGQTHIEKDTFPAPIYNAWDEAIETLGLGAKKYKISRSWRTSFVNLTRSLSEDTALLLKGEARQDHPYFRYSNRDAAWWAINKNIRNEIDQKWDDIFEKARTLAGQPRQPAQDSQAKPAPEQKEEDAQIPEPPRYAIGTSIAPGEFVVASAKPNGSRAIFEWGIMEADLLEALVSVVVNESQDRNRQSNMASQEQVVAIAANPDPMQLGPSNIAISGAPVVDLDGVPAGNARSLGMIEAYRRNGRGGSVLRQFVADAARALGMSDEQLSKFKRPVLVRKVKQYVNGTRADFVAENNPKSMLLPETETEEALKDLAAIGDMSRVEFTESGHVSADSAKWIAARLEKAQRRAKESSRGVLNMPELTKRVQRAALARVAQEAGVSFEDLQSIVEGSTGRRFSALLLKRMPQLNELSGDLQITGAFLKALRALQTGLEEVSSERFATLKEWYANRNYELKGVVGEVLTPEGEFLLELFVNLKQRQVESLLKDYADEAQKEQRRRNEAARQAEWSQLAGPEKPAESGPQIIQRLAGVIGSENPPQGGGEAPLTSPKPPEPPPQGDLQLSPPRHEAEQFDLIPPPSAQENVAPKVSDLREKARQLERSASIAESNLLSGGQHEGESMQQWHARRNAAFSDIGTLRKAAREMEREANALENSAAGRPEPGRPTQDTMFAPSGPAKDLPEETRAKVGKGEVFLEGETWEELSDLLNDPALGIDPEALSLWNALVQDGLVERLPLMKLAIIDYLYETGSSGSYTASTEIARMNRFTKDPTILPHELFHHIFKYLTRSDKQAVRGWRLEAVVNQLQDSKNATEIAQLQAILDAAKQGKALTSQSQKWTPGVYHLINDTEYFVSGMLGNAKTLRASEVANGWFASLIRWLRSFYNTLRDTVGLSSSQERLWRKILSGGYGYDPKAAREYTEGLRGADVQLSAPRPWLEGPERPNEIHKARLKAATEGRLMQRAYAERDRLLALASIKDREAFDEWSYDQSRGYLKTLYQAALQWFAARSDAERTVIKGTYVTKDGIEKVPYMTTGEFVEFLRENWSPQAFGDGTIPGIISSTYMGATLRDPQSGEVIGTGPGMDFDKLKGMIDSVNAEASARRIVSLQESLVELDRRIESDWQFYSASSLGQITDAANAAMDAGSITREQYESAMKLVAEARAIEPITDAAKRLERAKLAAQAKSIVTKKPVDKTTLSPQGEALATAQKNERAALVRLISRKRSNKRAAQMADEKLRNKSQNIQLLAAKEVLGDPVVKETFFRGREELESIQERFADALVTFEEAVKAADDDIGNQYAQAEAGRMALEITRIWEEFQRAKEHFDVNYTIRSEGIEKALGVIESKIKNLNAKGDDVDIFVQALFTGRDILDEKFENELLNSLSSVKVFAQQLADSRRWPDRSVKEVLELLLETGGKIDDELGQEFAELKRTTDDNFGVSDSQFATIIKALRTSPKFNDAVFALVDYYRREKARVLKKNGEGVNFGQAQAVLRQVRELASLVKPEGGFFTDEEIEANNQKLKAITEQLTGEIEKGNNLRAIAMKTLLADFTKTSVDKAALDFTKQMFAAVENDGEIGPLITLADERVGDRMQRMVLFNNEKITLVAYGAMKEDLVLEPTLMEEKTADALFDYFEGIAIYRDQWNELKKTYPNPEDAPPTEDRPYRMSLRKLRGLEAAYKDYGAAALDVTSKFYGTRSKTSRIVEEMHKWQVFREFIVGLERVTGIHGRMLRNAMLALGNATNKIGATYNLHQLDLKEARHAALKKHPEFKMAMEEYKVNVMAHLGSEGRRFSFNDEKAPKAGDVLPVNGIKIYQEDINFAKAVAKFGLSLDKAVRFIEANSGIEETQRNKSGKLDYFVRHPQAVGAISLPMHMGERANAFITDLKRAYAEAEKQGLPIADASMDMTAQSKHPVAVFWNNNKDLVFVHLMDSGREHRSIKEHPNIEAASKSVVLKVRNAGMGYRDVLRPESVEDFIQELWSGRFYPADPESTHFPPGTGWTRERFKTEWLGGLAQYYREAKALDAEQKAQADTSRSSRHYSGSEYTLPAAQFRIPSILYDYGSTTDHDFTEAGMRARSRLLVNAENMFEQAVKFLSDAKKKLSSQDESTRKRVVTPGTIEEIDRVLTLVRHLQDDLSKMHDEKHLRLMGGNYDWPPGWIKASLLVQPTVAIKNVILGHVLIALHQAALDRFSFGMGLISSAKNLVRTARSFAVHVLMNDSTKLTLATRDYVLSILDKQIVPFSQHIADQWIRGYFARLDQLKSSGLTVRRPLARTLKMAWKNAETFSNLEDVRKHGTNWGRIVKYARAGKQNVTQLARHVGAEFFDMLINAQAVTYVSFIEDELRRAGNEYAERRKATMSPEKFAAGPKAGDPEWTVTPEEFSKRPTSAGRKANLAAWRTFMDRSKLSLEMVLWRAYKGGLAAKESPENPIPPLLSESENEAMAQAWARNVNAGDMMNRPTMARISQWFSSITTFMGYSFNFLNEAFSTLNGAYGMNKAEMWINSLGAILFLSVSAALFGLLAQGASDKYRFYARRRQSIQLTVFDKEWWKMATAKESTFAAMVSALPLIGDLALSIRGQIVNNRGYNPAGRVLAISLADSMFSAIRGIFVLGGNDPRPLQAMPLPIRDLAMKYIGGSREVLPRVLPDYGDVVAYRQGVSAIRFRVEQEGWNSDKLAMASGGMTYGPTYAMRERITSAMMDRDPQKLAQAYGDLLAYYKDRGIENYEASAVRDFKKMHPVMSGAGGKKLTDEQWDIVQSKLSPSQKKSVQDAVSAWDWAASELGISYDPTKDEGGSRTASKSTLGAGGAGVFGVSGTGSRSGDIATASYGGSRPHSSYPSGADGGGVDVSPRIASASFGGLSAGPRPAAIRYRAPSRGRGASRLASSLRRIRTSAVSLPRRRSFKPRRASFRVRKPRVHKISVRRARASRRMSFA